jgi:hypothetical protein
MLPRAAPHRYYIFMCAHLTKNSVSMCTQRSGCGGMPATRPQESQIAASIPSPKRKVVLTSVRQCGQTALLLSPSLYAWCSRISPAEANAHSLRRAPIIFFAASTTVPLLEAGTGQASRDASSRSLTRTRKKSSFAATSMDASRTSTELPAIAVRRKS